MSIKFKKGMSLVEVVIASAIIAGAFIAIIAVNISLSKVSFQSPIKTQSSFLAKEGMDALRVMRDKSWTINIAPLNTGSEYYLYWDGSSWQSTATMDSIDGTFYRSFILDDVYRDGNFNIVSSGVSGSLDVNSRLVTVTVTWNEGGATSTRSVQSYLFNTLDN